MAEAIKEAYRGIEAGDGGPFGTVVVKDGQVIGRGHNQVVRNNDCTCHGEMIAIREACKTINNFNLSGAELYTTSEPCPMCLGTILWARIDKIYYGCTVKDAARIGFCDDDFYKKLSLSTNNLDITQIDLEECLKLFDDYSQIEDKVMY